MPFGLSFWVLVHDSLVYTLTERLYCIKTLESRDSLTKTTITGRSMQTSLFSGIWIASRTPDQLKGWSMGRGHTCYTYYNYLQERWIEMFIRWNMNYWSKDAERRESIYRIYIYTMKNKKVINNIGKYYSFEKRDKKWGWKTGKTSDKYHQYILTRYKINMTWYFKCNSLNYFFRYLSWASYRHFGY